MGFLSMFKSTFLLWVLWMSACGNQPKGQTVLNETVPSAVPIDSVKPITVAANRTAEYLPLLEGKRVGVVANQTSVIFKNINENASDENNIGYTHLIDSLLALQIDIKKVFAPEHGFRGKFDAGEKVKDDVDTKTGLALISLHGKNRKPTASQLQDVDMVLFDIQDVGVRFYTYIATLQLVMEACAENNIPIIVLDRPNPNARYVDGPTMEPEHTSFLGMTEIPLVYGMTIGEYATMINEEGWLSEKGKADLTVIPLAHWDHKSHYSLPIRPSPNLPNDLAINLYPSLGLFEGTDINAGRGTEFQFQRYGAPFLNKENYVFEYIPKPNFGSKYPKHDGVVCYGKDLSEFPAISEVSLQWLLDAYRNATDKKRVFLTEGFTKHAGTEKLQQQIEAGLSEAEIKASWQAGIDRFKQIREKYLLYPE
ncbi:DUF1343 domain-containing protein [Aggregatimonas sangjinii]|uniref:DUF1343 domain-containing protein n=1 Tax=Aggregatimonas sangjinii TaxID=2583587 RepID=A0A5B7SUN8_9FLAO|nr:DUF1343 domain-containing protein [Aggregatimonas sangjinii]QCX00999.1 DUF1343 domain-containing protein [Aggregatimonas sangjinii]